MGWHDVLASPQPGLPPTMSLFGIVCVRKECSRIVRWTDRELLEFDLGENFARGGSNVNGVRCNDFGGLTGLPESYGGDEIEATTEAV